MTDGAKIPEADWNRYTGGETRSAMQETNNGGWLANRRRALTDAAKAFIVFAVGTATVAAATGLIGGQDQEPSPTLNPEQQGIHQMERNGMPQSDEALKLDKQFPADHIQTKDIIVTSNAQFETTPDDNAKTIDAKDIIVNGKSLTSVNQFELTNGLEITRNGNTYLILMNLNDTNIYVNESDPGILHPFGDESVPAKHDTNGGYQSTDGNILAPNINVFNLPQTSPLD
jgi:hypothetical protein